MNWSRRHTWLAGLAILIVTNTFVLVHAALNRSGEPTNRMTLSPLELHVPWRNVARDENSGVSLSLAYVGPGLGSVSEYGPDENWDGPPDFSTQALQTFGFDLTKKKNDQDTYRYYSRTAAKPAYVVLEFNGPAYERTLNQARERLQSLLRDFATLPEQKDLKFKLDEAQRHLKWIENHATRLYVIDIAHDAEPLRGKYSDMARYLILPGTIKPVFVYSGTDGGKVHAQVSVTGHGEIHVPLPLSEAITPSASPYRENVFVQQDETEKSKPPFPSATLVWGSSYEPWVESIEPVPAKGSTDK